VRDWMTPLKILAVDKYGDWHRHISNSRPTHTPHPMRDNSRPIQSEFTIITELWPNKGTPQEHTLGGTRFRTGDIIIYNRVNCELGEETWIRSKTASVVARLARGHAGLPPILRIVNHFTTIIANPQLSKFEKEDFSESVCPRSIIDSEREILWFKTTFILRTGRLSSFAVTATLCQYCSL
jgi:hypothetical protein